MELKQLLRIFNTKRKKNRKMEVGLYNLGNRRKTVIKRNMFVDILRNLKRHKTLNYNGLFGIYIDKRLYPIEYDLFSYICDYIVYYKTEKKSFETYLNEKIKKILETDIRTIYDIINEK
uniref:Uncharacterized protein n=1 Tax=viral metagenome TaxID=1070528 RepID=A0A6C0H4L8_9ZZZZ